MEILHDAVVGKDPELIVREDNRQKPSIFLPPCVARILALGGGGRPVGTGRAVVTVGDIEQIEASEGLHVGLCVGHSPAGVLHAVGSDKVENRDRCSIGLHPGGQRLALRITVAEAEKDRLGMAGRGEQMPGTVIFLVGPGLLMLANLTRAILLSLDAADDAQLGHARANLAIEVEAGCRVADQRACRNHPLQVCLGMRVDLGSVAVGLRGEVDFREDDVEERPRLPCGPLPGLIGRDHIVGIAGDLGGKHGRGTQRSERMNANHRTGFSKGSGDGRIAASPCSVQTSPSGPQGSLGGLSRPGPERSLDATASHGGRVRR